MSPRHADHSQSHLRVHTLDDLEVLARRLAQRMAEEPLPPLVAETIVVQSQGMARWLHQFVARELGIAASLHTPFPATFLQRLAELALPDQGPRPALDPFAPEPMTWRVHRLLRELAERPGFEPLQGYLTADSDDGEPDQRKAVQLAARIAQTFEQYGLYRPDMLLEWQGANGAQPTLPFGEGSSQRHPHRAWQRTLWRALTREVEDSGGRPLCAVLEALRVALGGRDPLPAGALPRVAVFGVSHLPPPMLDVLHGLARHRPVDLYLMLPPGERDRRAHPLVERFGRQGDELWELLLARDPDGHGFEDVYGDVPDPASLSTLGVLQQDLRDLVDRRPAQADDPDASVEPPLPADPADRSLTLHVCHNPRREVEVIRDQILAAFAELPDLTPADVLVLVPDMETYAPHLIAVFDQPLGGSANRERSLPLTVADRNSGAASQVFGAFRQVLRTLRSRMERSDLLALFDAAPVRAALSLTLDDINVLEAWFETVGVRWGIDGIWREREFAVPREDAHSLRRGLDRLLLGLCTGPVEGDAAPAHGVVIGGLAPHGEATGSRAELLGRCAELADRLQRAADRCRIAHAWAGWLGILTGLLDDFIAPVSDSDEDAIRTLRELLGEIAGAAEVADHEVPLPFAAVVEVLEERLERQGQGQGFLTGSITACALRPMRSIPFRVIAIAGMNDDRFPRADRHLPFDLMPSERRRGDRSTRDDDRQLFLETLLAARDRLVLTYTGYSPRDGSERPPSLCVAELMDHVDRSFASDRGPARDLWTTEHPLHGFVADGIEEGCRFTYDRVDPAKAAPTFVEAADPPPPRPARTATGDTRTMPLADLLAFWRHPQRWFCREVLGLRVPPLDDPLPGAEPFLLDKLEEYHLRATVFDRSRRAANARLESPIEDPTESRNPWWRAADALPHGGPGTVQLDRARAEAAPLLEALRRFEPETVSIDLAVPEFGIRIVGSIDGVGTQGNRLQVRPAKVKAKDELAAWIHHVVLSLRAQQLGLEPPRSTALGIGKQVTIAPVEDPLEGLWPLLAGFDRGQSRPLPHFETSSKKMAERALSSGVRDAVPLDVQRDWRATGMSTIPADGDDAWIRYVYRDGLPLDRTAMEWALAVWEPCLAVLSEESR